MTLGIVIILGLLLYVTPRVARPGLLFGVTMDPAVQSSEAAERIRRRYGIEIVLHSAIALALGIAINHAAGVLWQVFGASWAFVNGHRSAMPYASGEDSFREPALKPPREDSLPSTILAIAPLALLALLAWYAGSHWNLSRSDSRRTSGFTGRTNGSRAVHARSMASSLCTASSVCSCS